MEQQKEYYAFISYKREDEKWAKWLQDKLEHYKFPTNLNGRTDLPKYIRPTFRDVTDLYPGLLAEEINNALQYSEWLIVVCSPRSAKSPWVCKEAQTFIDLGRADHIIPFVIEGIPFSNDMATECYPEALLNLTGSKELLAANINEMGRDAAAIKVVARMFNLRFDALWQRHEREKQKRRNWIVVVTIFAFLCISGIAFLLYWQNQQTQKANWKLMENQARAVAEKAMKEIQDGNVYESILACLEMLPKNKERPFLPELECALRAAYDSLYTMPWTFRLIESQIFEDAFLSNKENYIIVSKGKNIIIYDFNCLNECLRISTPVVVDGYNCRSTLSTDETQLYVTDSTVVRCYSISDGRLIDEIPSYDFEKGKSITSNLYRSGKDCNAISGLFEYRNSPMNKWTTKLLGLDSKEAVADYNQYSGKALINRCDEIYLYDCDSKKEVGKISFPSPPYECIGEISDCSFSKDGKKIIISHSLNGALIYDIETATTKFFDCTQCHHYSSWMRFSNNGRLLHSSRTKSKLDIIDESTLAVVDSILPRYDAYVWDAYLNKEMNRCLVLADNELYIYFKQMEPNSIGEFDKKDFVQMNTPLCEDTIIRNRFHLRVIEEGLTCMDMRGEYNNWNHKCRYGCDIVGFAYNDRYLLVQDHERWISYFCILDLYSGIEVYREDKTQPWFDYFYNPNSGQFLLEYLGSDNLVQSKIYNFLPIDTVISRLKNLTKGMKLYPRERRDFFLKE